MISVFDIPDPTSRSIPPGEMHLHESDHSCSSLFTYPNIESLKGIAPHFHDFCDDIEVVLSGEIAVLKTQLAAKVVPSPYLILNPPKKAHGFFVKSRYVSVFGFRCPKSYQGKSLLSEWSSGQAAQEVDTSATTFVDLSQAGNSQYVTEHTTVCIHALIDRELLPGIASPERALLTLASIKLHSPDWQSERCVPKHALVILPGDVPVTCSSSTEGAIVIEFIPLGKY